MRLSVGIGFFLEVDMIFNIILFILFLDQHAMNTSQDVQRYVHVCTVY